MNRLIMGTQNGMVSDTITYAVSVSVIAIDASCHMGSGDSIVSEGSPEAAASAADMAMRDATTQNNK